MYIRNFKDVKITLNSSCFKIKVYHFHENDKCGILGNDDDDLFLQHLIRLHYVKN